LDEDIQDWQKKQARQILVQVNRLPRGSAMTSPDKKSWNSFNYELSGGWQANYANHTDGTIRGS
jgi:hypothetical protein